jgi:lysophospholipase L1-like esterase
VGEWLLCQRPDLRLTIRNGAVCFSLAEQMLARFDQHVAPLRPGLVVLTIGVNDALRGIAPETIAHTMSEYCYRLRSLCGGRVIYLGGRWWRRIADAEAPAREECCAALAAAVARVVREHGGLALDAPAVLAHRLCALKALWPGHTIFHDDIHFNPVGHEILAGIVLRALGLLELPGDEEPQELM